MFVCIICIHYVCLHACMLVCAFFPPPWYVVCVSWDFTAIYSMIH